MVFLGTLKYFPNREGLVWFLEKVFPEIRKKVKDATLIVIGEKDSRITKKYVDDHIIYRGILDNLESELSKGRIFIAPIRIGTGTRLKIVTAMAFGMPIVSASVGIEGINVGENEGAIITDTENDFAKAAISLLENKERRFKMGENARRFVEREYSWDVIFKDLSLLYKNLLSN
jgi:glycosyltransferase involved in cell wall biosynthesis